MTKILSLPFRVLNAIIEAFVSRRGLPLGFLFLSLLMVATMCWIRPPLSSDIFGIRVPLGIWKSTTESPEDILDSTRPFQPASGGLLLMAIILAGMVIVYRRPDKFGMIAGLLVCGSVIVNAAAALNHPALIELLDLEFEQRAQMAAVIRNSPDQVTPLTTARNGRADILTSLTGEEQRGDPVRGWLYLMYGRWALTWGMMGVVFGYPGPIRNRAGYLLLWTGAGFGLACLVCFQRLHAEYHWIQAKNLESDGQFKAAQRALETAISIFPEFDRLERTWLLAGKLDYREKIFYQDRRVSSRKERFFQAYQLTRDQVFKRDVAYNEDLPWLITQVPDLRTGTSNFPTGSDVLANPPRAAEDLGLTRHRQGESALQVVPPQRIRSSRGFGPIVDTPIIVYRKQFSYAGYTQPTSAEIDEEHYGQLTPLSFTGIESRPEVAEQIKEGQQGVYYSIYKATSKAEKREAISIMEDLVKETDNTEPPVRHQMARFYTDVALEAFLISGRETDEGLSFNRQNQKLGEAFELLKRATRIAPEHLDARFYRGFLRSRIRRDQPELVRADFEPVLQRLDDVILYADILIFLGDAYFEANQMNEARTYYAKSLDVYDLPKRINYRGQKRLGGI